jgi:nitroimidazol reductase NimA-like FMN-containing flavoprotein (pyridoxamine 5'-phosphate oxidase superfamily)
MMRRKEREITEKGRIEEILRRSVVCRLAMSVDDQPYLVPLCFGYKDGNLYFHCAREGMKVDMLNKNNKVCFECDIDHEVVRSDTACEWAMKGLSVIGLGRAYLLDSPEAKREALDLIMEHYGGEEPFFYKEKGFHKSLIIKVEIESMTGKKLG